MTPAFLKSDGKLFQTRVATAAKVLLTNLCPNHYPPVFHYKDCWQILSALLSVISSLFRPLNYIHLQRSCIQLFWCSCLEYRSIPEYLTRDSSLTATHYL